MRDWTRNTRGKGKRGEGKGLICDIESERKDKPGNSVRETGLRIKGGAVRLGRSPEKEAIL